MIPMREEIPLTSRLRIREDIVWRDLAGEVVILNLKSGYYYGLNPMGTAIWHLLQTHHSLEKVLNALLEEYEVTEAQGERPCRGSRERTG